MNFETQPNNNVVIEEDISHPSSLPALSHNSSKGHIEENDITDSNDIPDMNVILTKFGIDTTKLVPVPLEKYDFQRFDFEKTIYEIDMSSTISQRIKAMTRRARMASTYKSSHSLGD